LIAVEELKKPDRFHSVFQLFARLLYRKHETRAFACEPVWKGGYGQPIRLLEPYSFVACVATALLASNMFSNGR
jgi:hypothetical protein